MPSSLHIQSARARLCFWTVSCSGKFLSTGKSRYPRSQYRGISLSSIMDWAGGQWRCMASWRTKSSSSLARFVVLLFSICLATPGSVQARTKSASVKLDGDYVSALAVANRFLTAWQTADREDGLVMLTDAAKQGRSEDQLQEFFSPGDGAAYEIGRGTKLRTGRYSFPVTLLQASRWRVHPRASQVIVIRSGRE